MALSKTDLKRVINSAPEPDGDDVGKWVVGVCRAIEAEVRRQDEALILQLVEALEKADKISGYPNNRKTITAARAWLEGKSLAAAIHKLKEDT